MSITAIRSRVLALFAPICRYSCLVPLKRRVANFPAMTSMGKQFVSNCYCMLLSVFTCISPSRLENGGEEAPSCHANMRNMTPASDNGVDMEALCGCSSSKGKGPLAKLHRFVGTNTNQRPSGPITHHGSQTLDHRPTNREPQTTFGASGQCKDFDCLIHKVQQRWKDSTKKVKGPRRSEKKRKESKEKGRQPRGKERKQLSTSGNETKRKQKMRGMKDNERT